MCLLVVSLRALLSVLTACAVYRRRYFGKGVINAMIRVHFAWRGRGGGGAGRRTSEGKDRPGESARLNPA